MSNNFDPTTHKFGMAYTSTDETEGIIHISLSHGLNPVKWIFDDGSIYEGSIKEAKITRAPEHDLIPRAEHEEACQMIANQMETIRDYQLNYIPRADVMELVKALDELLPIEIVRGDSIRRLNPSSGQIINSGSNWGVTKEFRTGFKLKECIATLNEAITNFKQKYGEDIAKS